MADATAMASSSSARGRSSQRGAGPTSSITESILGNIKNVLKRMTTSQMLGCVLSGFVIDVQSKITSDGLLEGVRLMSAASVCERSRIACETSSGHPTPNHGQGASATSTSSTANAPGATSHHLHQNGSNSNNNNKSREEALRELRQHHHIETSGAAIGSGGPAGFYDPILTTTRGGVMGGTAIDDFSGVHALEQSMNTRAAQKQRQRAVEEEIQRIRDRELQMREDIRPVSVAGESRSSGSVAPDHHHHERRHSHHQHSYSQPHQPSTSNNSHFPSPNRGGHAAVRASSTHSHAPSTNNLGDHYQHHHHHDDTTMAMAPTHQPTVNRSEHNDNNNPVTSSYTGASPSPAPFHRNGFTTHSITTSDPYVLEQRIRQNLRDDALLRESSSRPTMSVPQYSSSSVTSGGGVGEYEATLIRGQSTTSNNMTTLSSLKTQDMYGDVGSLLNQLEREEKAAERGIRMQRDRLHMPHHHNNSNTTPATPTPTVAPIQDNNHRREDAPTTSAVTASTKKEEPAVVEHATPSPQTPTKVTPTPLVAVASPAPTNPTAATTSTAPQSPLAATTTPANSGSTTSTTGGTNISGPSPAGWVAKKDPATGRMFYSNKALGKSTWKRIETDLPAEEDTQSPTPVTAVTLETHSPGEGWKGVEDKSTGKTYFVNKALGKSSWKLAETNPVPKVSSPASETTTTTATPTVPEAATPIDTAATTTSNVAAAPAAVTAATPPAKSVPPPPPTKTAPPPPKKSVPPPPTPSTAGKSAPAPHVEVSCNSTADKDNTQENERRRQEEENKKSENKSVIKTATGKSLADALREQQAKMEAEEKERGPRPIAVARGSGGATQSTANEAEKEPEAKPAETVAAAVAPEPQSPAKKGVPPPPPPKKSVPPPPPKKSVPPPPPKKSVPAAPAVAAPTPAEPAAAETATPSSPTTATETATPSSPTTVTAGNENASRGASPSGGGGGGPGAGKIYGSYKEVYDPKSKRYYYRHLVTKEANWTMPPEVAALKKRDEGAGGDEGGAPTPAAAATSPSSPASPPKIVVNASGNRTCGPWIEKEDPKSGRMYYANAETKGRTWKIQETSFAAHM